MATVTIYHDEAAANALPNVCMKCGAPATTFQHKTFRCCVQGTPFGEWVAPLFGRRMTVTVPWCENHRLHWIWRSVVGVGGFVILSSSLIGVIVMLKYSQGRTQDNLLGLLLLVNLGLWLVWYITLLSLGSTAIQPFKVTRDYMQLIGVAEEFRDALEDYRYYDREAAPSLEHPDTVQRTDFFEDRTSS